MACLYSTLVSMVMVSQVGWQDLSRITSLQLSFHITYRPGITFEAVYLLLATINHLGLVLLQSEENCADSLDQLDTQRLFMFHTENIFGVNSAQSY